MLNFKKFIVESEESTADFPAVDFDMKSINEDLNGISNQKVITAEAVFEKIRSILEEHEIEFQPLTSHESDFGEEVYQIGENVYVYINYELMENGHYEFCAEMVDKNELNAIMSMGENEEEL